MISSPSSGDRVDDRKELLEASIKARLSDTRTHVEALEAAVAGLSGEFDLAAFEEAWLGGAQARLSVYPIQAGYENVINGCVKIAQELCELEGWTAANVEATAAEALKELRVHGLISAQTLDALRDAYARRSEVQHDYVGAVARDVYAATVATLEHAPSLLQDVALYIKQRA